MSRPFPLVTVIVPTYRDWPRMQLCVNALKNQTYPPDRFEVLIVNNDPEDKPPRHFKLPPSFKLMEESKPGSYAARNLAMQHATGEIIAFTDSDCVPEQNWIEKAVECLSESKADRVAGHVELFFQGEKPTMAEIYEKAFAFKQDVNAKEGLSVTANLVTFRRVFDSVGHFNQGMMSGGDLEWNTRATKLGFSIIYCHDCIVNHPARADLAELKSKLERVVGGRRKTNSHGKLWFVLPLLPPFKLIPALKRSRCLSLKEKIIAFMIAYYLRLFKLKAEFLLRLGMKNPKRV